MVGRTTVCCFLFISLFGLASAKELYREPPKSRFPLEQTVECADGFVMDGTFCKKESTTPSKVVCDSGVLEGNDCISYYAANRDCPPDFELYNGKCMKTQEKLPAPSCAEDQVLEGVSCVSRKILEPMCPKGTVDIDGDKCAMYYASSKRCPSGYTPSGSYHKSKDGATCDKTLSAPPTEKCTKGFSLVDGGGKCELVKTLDPVCPTGTIEEGDQCAWYKPAQRRCLPEFTLSGEKCIKKVTEIATPTCDIGNVLSKDQNKCVKTSSVDPVCASNRKELPDGRCATFSPARATCGDDFALSYVSGSAKCMKAEKIAGSVTCNDGYEVEGSSCVMRTPAPMVCPNGSKAEGEQCVTESQAAYKCPESYQLKSEHYYGRQLKAVGEKTCMKIDVLAATASCTKEFVLSDKPGLCEKDKTCDPLYVCDKGAKDGDSCVEYTPTSPVYSCPDGYASNSATGRSRCVKIVQKDCSKVEYQVKCQDIPECFTKDCEEKYAIQHARALRNIGTGFFRSSKSQSKQQVCEKIAVTVPKTCEKTLFADAMTTCPDGTQAEGRGCVTAKYHPQSVKCPEGVFDEGSRQCVKRYFKPSVYACGDGYTMSQQRGEKKCVKANFTDFEYYCDGLKTLKNKSCFGFVDKVCEGGVCERKHALLADFDCPDGFSKVDGEQVQGGSFGACVMREEIGPVYMCPEDSDLVNENQCAKYFPKECIGGSCERTSVYVPKYECREGLTLLTASKPIGHTLFSGMHMQQNIDTKPKCATTVLKIPELFCSKAESVVKGGKCVKYSQKKCPNGKCQISMYKAPVYECPPEYSQQKEYDAHSKLAPLMENGGKLFSKKMKKFGPTQVTCVKTEHIDFEYFCSKGEMSSPKKCAKYFSKACPNHQCEVKLSTAPQMDCDESAGYKLVKPHSSFFQKTESSVPLCRATIFEEPAFKCHKGESDVTGKRCKKSTPPKYVCPRKSTRSGDTCVVTMFEKPIVSFSH